jgi:hypothetical protein
MHAHLRLIAVPVDAADTLGDVETQVLLQLDPSLNLDKVAGQSTADSAVRAQEEVRAQATHRIASIGKLIAAIQANFAAFQKESKTITLSHPRPGCNAK